MATLAVCPRGCQNSRHLFYAGEDGEKCEVFCTRLADIRLITAVKYDISYHSDELDNSLLIPPQGWICRNKQIAAVVRTPVLVIGTNEQ
jgi:hypothetical protein